MLPFRTTTMHNNTGLSKHTSQCQRYSEILLTHIYLFKSLQPQKEFKAFSFRNSCFKAGFEIAWNNQKAFPLCSVWTEETVCTVLNSTITADINCSYSCGTECWRSSKFPCLQVYVSVNASGRVALLSHNEDTLEQNSEVRQPGQSGRRGLQLSALPPGDPPSPSVEQLKLWMLRCYLCKSSYSLFHFSVEGQAGDIFAVALISDNIIYLSFLNGLKCTAPLLCPWFTYS